MLLFSVYALTSIDSCTATQWDQMIPEDLPVEYAYIRSNGEIDPPFLPIEQSGNTYYLEEDIANYSIRLEKEGIVLDGKGHLLSFPSYGEQGEFMLKKNSWIN